MATELKLYGRLDDAPGFAEVHCGPILKRVSVLLILPLGRSHVKVTAAAPTTAIFWPALFLHGVIKNPAPSELGTLHSTALRSGVIQSHESSLLLLKENAKLEPDQMTLFHTTWAATAWLFQGSVWPA